MLAQLKKFVKKRVSKKTLLFGHKLMAIWANIKYGFPARGLLVIGVTGTKGKTTTAHFITSILEEAGYTVGMATTVDFQIAGKRWTNDSNKSVLPPEQLFKLIKDMRQARCNALVIEVTSHAIDQHRIWGIPFKYVGLTNVTHDHLDYHGTWENYRNTKLKLFQSRSVKAIAVNADDPSAGLFLKKTTAGRRWSYSIESEVVYADATDFIQAQKISGNPNGSSFNLITDQEQTRLTLQMPGRFNIENALCAAALCLNLNLKVATIAAGLQNLEAVPGRLERIETKKGFTIMIDYAHTPDSLEKLYSALQPDVRGRMMAVIGSCGDRDKTKRPIMGALAARFNDFVFVTDEEPYGENPQEIIEEVAKGVPRGRALFQPHQPTKERPIFKKDNESGEGDWWWKISDRKEAISKAIDMAKLDDLILVTGMGSQNYKIVGDKKVAWNDRKIIEELLLSKNIV